MKFHFVFFVLLIVSNLLNAQSSFKAGLIAGITTTQIDGDGYSGFDKAGFEAGGFVNNNFGSQKWSGQIELIFVQKGSRRPPNLEKGITQYQINLNYVEIPVLAKFRYKKLLYETGFSFGQLINHSEFDMSGELLNTPRFKKNEFAFDAGLSVFFTEKLTLNARFVRSILPVRDFVYLARYGFLGFIGGSYNTVLSYTIRYQFGENEKQNLKTEK